MGLFKSLWQRTGQKMIADVISYWQSPLNQLNDADLIKRNVGYVWRCITSRAEAVARIEFKALERLPDGTTRENPKHPFLQVLHRPNPQMSTFRMVELTQQSLDATGNAYWYYPIGSVTAKPKEIYWLDSRKVRPVVDQRFSNGEANKFGLVTGYLYRRNDGTDVPFETNEIEHFMYANLDNPNIGVGVIEAGLQYIKTENITTEFSKRALENNATPSGILVIKNAADQAAFDEFKAKWRQEYGSVRNTGKIAMINGGEVEFIKMGTSLAEIALKEIKNMSRDDIMMMFACSKPILGITEDVNLANARVAEHVFAKRVVEPLMHRLVDTLQQTARKWGENYELSFESPVPEDMESKAAYYKIATGGLGWMSPDEVREEIETLEPLGGNAEKLHIPFNMTPIDPEAAPEGGEGEKSANPKVKVVLSKAKKKDSESQPATKELTYEVKENFRLSLMQVQEHYEQKFQEKVVKFARAQEKEVLAALPSEKRLSVIASKAFEEVLWDEGIEAAKMTDATLGVTLSLTEEAGKLAAQLAGLEPDEFILTPEIRQGVTDAINRMSSSYNATTKEALIKELTEALTAQESIAKIRKRVQSVYGKATKERAELVARTETLKASNFAARSAYAQTGYIQKLEWFVNPNACEFCLPFKGKVIDITGSFAQVGQTVDGVGEDGQPTGHSYALNYEEVNHPPLHPQCRCSVLPVFE